MRFAAQAAKRRDMAEGTAVITRAWMNVPIEWAEVRFTPHAWRTDMQNLIARFVREEEGQDLIEYALLATLIALAAGVGAALLGTNLNVWYDNMAQKVSGWSAKAK